MGAPSREAEQHTSPKPVRATIEGTKVYDSRGKHVGSIKRESDWPGHLRGNEPRRLHGFRHDTFGEASRRRYREPTLHRSS